MRSNLILSKRKLVKDTEPTLKRIYEYSYPFEAWGPGENSRFLFICPGEKEMLLYDNTETVVYECTDAEKVKKQIDLMTIPEEAISPLEFSMDCDVKITGRSAKERTIARFTDANGSSYKITSTGVFGLGLVLDSQPNDVIRIYRT